jgi:RNA polymerase sigma-70 factor (ECF subfamily)
LKLGKQLAKIAEQQPQFDLFYAEHAAPGFRFALRLCGNHEDAEDLTAQALAKAFVRWNQYRGDANPRTWLFKILLNEWRMQCRKSKIPATQLDDAERIPASTPFDDVGLAVAIASLTVAQREAVLLVKGEGLTHAEAAKVAGVPVGTMYFRVHSAMKALRKLLTETDEDLSGLNQVAYEVEL